MAAKILLRGGTVLIHDENQHVIPQTSNLLIEGDIITKIQDHIEIGSDTKVIDCQGKLVSPGFISTHNHLYQTALKGLHANQSLATYMICGNLAGSLFSLEDGFWGQLGGALESIDAGTTTVVDHSSWNYSLDHPKIAVQALITSGLRTIYCYAHPRTVTFSPLSVHDDVTGPAFLGGFSALASAAPFANGRVQLGLAFDSTFLPTEVVQPIFNTARTQGSKLITTHSVGGPMFNTPPSGIQMLAKHGVLGPDVIASHACYPPADDAKLLQECGGFVSSTPNTEMQMGLPPVSLRPEYKGHGSIGVDCHSWGSGFMPSQMRLMLQAARCERGVRLEAEGKWSVEVGPTVEDVFNLATVGGAKAVGMEDQVGRIGVGRKADLVVFGTTSPSMLAAAVEDPVAAIVLYSSERDVEVVIVDGVVRKEDGRLVDVEGAVEVCDGKALGIAGRRISWADVVLETLKSRKVLKEKLEAIDIAAERDRLIDAMHANRAGLLESK